MKREILTFFVHLNSSVQNNEDTKLIADSQNQKKMGQPNVAPSNF